MKETRISTDRLTLFPLSIDQLRAYIDKPNKPNQMIGALVSRRILTERLRRALKMKIAKMAKANVDEHHWLTYWLIVINEDGFGAGLVGFKGVPNEAGEVEIGYGIDPDYQGKGHVTEAVKALIDWAFQSDTCMSVLAPDTERENVASNRVLEKVGMYIYFESEDTLSWRINKVV